MLAEPMLSPTPGPALAVRPETLAPGRIVDGKYRIEEPIAFGGMGVVFAAIHVGLERAVALKCIRREFAANADVVERFLNEARAAARLRNEHVARVLDFGRTPDGLPYLVMERLDGADLYGVLAERGPLPVTEAVDYVLQSCQAVAEAHALGIVHRDIKPENLFLSRGIDGRQTIKVLDFGISKQLRSGPPWYMSPEQMRRPELVDARSDIWSLGVVLFELLTRTTPFDGETVSEVCAAALTRPSPSASARVKGVPKELDEVLERCLAKTRELRYPNVAELARALHPFGSAEALARVQAIETTLGVTPRAETRTALGRYRRNLAVGTLATLVLGTAGAWLGLQHHQPRMGALETAPDSRERSERSQRSLVPELSFALPPVLAERELAVAAKPARARVRAPSPSAELPAELVLPPAGIAEPTAPLESESELDADDVDAAPALQPLPELPRELLGEAP